MKFRRPLYRGIWEGKCLVDGCNATCFIVGDWLPDPRSPGCFNSVFKQIESPGGWVYQHREHLAHGDVSVNQGLLCLEHAPAWREYLAAVTAWDEDRRSRRKTWWQSFKSIFTGDPPAPASPYEMCP